MKYAHNAQNPPCSHYDAVVLQIKLLSSSTGIQMMAWMIIHVMNMKLVIFLLIMEKVEYMQTSQCNKNSSSKTSSKGKQTAPWCPATSVIDLTSYEDNDFIYLTSNKPDCNQSNQQEVNSSQSPIQRNLILKFLRMEKAFFSRYVFHVCEPQRVEQLPEDINGKGLYKIKTCSSRWVRTSTDIFVMTYQVEILN